MIWNIIYKISKCNINFQKLLSKIIYINSNCDYFKEKLPHKLVKTNEIEVYNK
jgi:hypothetical protein